MLLFDLPQGRTTVSANCDLCLLADMQIDPSPVQPDIVWMRVSCSYDASQDRIAGLRESSRRVASN